MKGHYLMLAFGDRSSQGVLVERREYFEIDEDEETESALTRWVASHPTMIDRQRNRDRQETILRESVLFTNICRPSSWHRAKAEEAGLPYPVPPGKGRVTRRRT